MDKFITPSAQAKKNDSILSSTKTLLLMSLLMISSKVMAHPGHDHSANESILVHTIFYGLIVLTLVVGAVYTYRNFKKGNKNLPK